MKMFSQRKNVTVENEISLPVCSSNEPFSWDLADFVRDHVLPNVLRNTWGAT